MRNVLIFRQPIFNIFSTLYNIHGLKCITILYYVCKIPLKQIQDLILNSTIIYNVIKLFKTSIVSKLLLGMLLHIFYRITNKFRVISNNHYIPQVYNSNN